MPAALGSDDEAGNTDTMQGASPQASLTVD